VVAANSLLDPDAADTIEKLDGYVRNTFTVPEKVTAVLELDEEKIVVLVKVGPVVEYVPRPTSQFPETSNAL
jgi:hypothetical protein